MFEHTLYRVTRSAGLQVLQRRGTGGARELTTLRLRLAPGERAAYHSRDEETVLVLLEGAGSVEAGGEHWGVGRRDVFSERATAAYLPAGVATTVTAQSPLEAILVSTPAAAAGRPVLIGPDAVRVPPPGPDGLLRAAPALFLDEP